MLRVYVLGYRQGGEGAMSKCVCCNPIHNVGMATRSHRQVQCSPNVQWGGW